MEPQFVQAWEKTASGKVRPYSRHRVSACGAGAQSCLAGWSAIAKPASSSRCRMRFSPPPPQPTKPKAAACLSLNFMPGITSNMPGMAYVTHMFIARTAHEEPVRAEHFYKFPVLFLLHPGKLWNPMWRIVKLCGHNK